MGLAGKTGLDRPWLVFRETTSCPQKPSAWVECEDPSVVGMGTMWDTGECDIDLGSTTDPDVTMIQTRQLASAEDVTRALTDAMDFAESVMAAEAGQ